MRTHGISTQYCHRTPARWSTRIYSLWLPQCKVSSGVYNPSVTEHSKCSEAIKSWSISIGQGVTICYFKRVSFWTPTNARTDVASSLFKGWNLPALLSKREKGCLRVYARYSILDKRGAKFEVTFGTKFTVGENCARTSFDQNVVTTTSIFHN